MTPEQLADILLGLTAYEPQAVALLRERRRETGEAFPDPRETPIPVIRAARELREMARIAREMGNSVRQLRPVAIESPEAEGYSL